MLGDVVSWPPTGPTSATLIKKAYVYTQFSDDDNVTAFFDATNLYTQAYLDYFNSLNLPIYTKSPVSGSLLDWVAQGLYGIARPALPTSLGTAAMGPVNTFMPNSLPVNGYTAGVSDTYTATNDDTFRRIITWNFQKGDGKVFNPRWLKRRINRFLTGENGQDAPDEMTYNISVALTGFKEWTITIPNTTIGQIFKIAVETGALEMPVQITFIIDLV